MSAGSDGSGLSTSESKPEATDEKKKKKKKKVKKFKIKRDLDISKLSTKDKVGIFMMCTTLKRLVAASRAEVRRKHKEKEERRLAR